jgi:hypothetical protein
MNKWNNNNKQNRWDDANAIKGGERNGAMCVQGVAMTLPWNWLKPNLSNNTRCDDPMCK